MRKNPTHAEIIANEVGTEAHQLVLQWRSTWPEKRWVQMEAVEEFAEWLIGRKPQSGTALRDLAARLTPNPALTVDGTLAIILDGIDRLDVDMLARSLAQANMRQAGFDAGLLSDADWRAGDIQSKLRLIRAVQALKEALRTASAT